MIEEWEIDIREKSGLTYQDVTSNAIAFAQACMDMNSIPDLVGAETLPADLSDCETWGISDEEWHWATLSALYAKQHDGCIGDSGRVYV